MRARMDMSPGYTLCCAGCTTGGFRGLRTSSQPVTGQPVLLWIWIIRLIICRILSETSHVLSDLTLLGAACSRTACFAQIGLSQPRRVHGTSQDQVVRTKSVAGCSRVVHYQDGCACRHNASPHKRGSSAHNYAGRHHNMLQVKFPQRHLLVLFTLHTCGCHTTSRFGASATCRVVWPAIAAPAA